MRTFNFLGHPEIPAVKIACDAFGLKPEFFSLSNGSEAASLIYKTHEGLMELIFGPTDVSGSDVFGSTWFGEFVVKGHHGNLVVFDNSEGVPVKGQAFDLSTGSNIKTTIDLPAFNCHHHHRHHHHSVDGWMVHA